MTRTLLVIFLGSLLYTGLINTLNVRHIRLQNPGNAEVNARSLVFNSTVYSIDNYWYVNQFKNLLEHGRFTNDINKDRYEVRRTPVYPVFYGLHYWLFGEEKSYDYIRYTQAFLMALAVVALFLAMLNFTGNKTVAWLSAVLYGLYPPVVATVFFTMTESISSELVCFCLYFLSLAWQSTRGLHWFLAGFMFALAALCRPTVIFLSVPVAGLLWSANRQSFRNFIIRGAAFSLGALLLFAPWTIRNYRITGDVIFLEKYYGDPMDYGMPNIHLRHWIACWNNPADYTSERVSNLMRKNLFKKEPISGDSLIAVFVSEMPKRAFKGNSPDKVKEALGELYAFYAAGFRDTDSATLSFLESRASQDLIYLRTNFIRDFPFQYYVVRNILFLKSIVFQGNTSALAFLDNYEQMPVRKFAKAVLYLIHVLCWFSLLFLFFWHRHYAAFYWMSVLFVALSVFAAVYLLSYYEARYSVPLLPLLFGCLAIWLTEMASGLRLKKNR